MAGHLLRDFQLASVLQVRGDAGGAEAVCGNSRADAGVQSISFP